MQRLALASPLIILAILGGSILIAYALMQSGTPKAVATIPEGATVADINEILQEKGILAEDLPQDLEGYLFPDTYEFFVPSSREIVLAKFQENFDRKVRAILPAETSEKNLKEILVKASLVEREVPDLSERRITAGIMMKRLRDNVPLQMDASICYVKGDPCLPITAEDKLLDSPYNTYRVTGLPPGPIANPGQDAVSAVISPVSTSYWFYISDPLTKKTVFAETLDEHKANIVKYLNTAN